MARANFEIIVNFYLFVFCGLAAWYAQKALLNSNFSSARTGSGILLANFRSMQEIWVMIDGPQEIFWVLLLAGVSLRVLCLLLMKTTFPHYYVL